MTAEQITEIEKEKKPEASTEKISWSAICYLFCCHLRNIRNLVRSCMFMGVNL